MDIWSYGLFLVGCGTFIGGGIYAWLTGNNRIALITIMIWAIIFACWNMYRYLWGDHEYRADNGKAQIRHGRLGQWEDLLKHLKEKHNIEL